MASIRWKNTASAPKVKGPIRCHSCRLMCRDAEHYLSHQCKTYGVNLVLARVTR